MNSIFWRKLSLLICITLLMLLFIPERASGQSPFFRFTLTPSFENGKITYRVDFTSRVKWTMTKITFKIPLPEGTRLVEANASPITTASFDGAEITFFTDAVANQAYIPTATFVVEVIDTSKTVFEAHAWISWEGDQPGNYLTEAVPIDITQLPLNWTVPAQPRLLLEADAAIVNDVITYNFYAKKEARLRMQDVKINVPLPEGTTFLSAEAPHPFVANFDGQEISFFALELERNVEVGPLTIKVSSQEAATPFIVTHAWAVWKNVGWQVGKSIVAQEDTRTGDIIVQPHVSQRVVSDLVGDVPFSTYDITSVAFEDYDSVFKLIFQTTGDLEPVGEPLEFVLFVDSDCNLQTGMKWNREIGADYQVRYRHNKGWADIDFWDGDQWQHITQGKLVNPVNSKTMAVWVPYDLLGLKDPNHFCWVAEARNRTTKFNPSPPYDTVVPSRQDLRFVRSQPAPADPITEVSTAQPAKGNFIQVGDVWQYLPGWAEPPPNWNQVNFDDSEWFSGPTSIGYGDGNYATDLGQITPGFQPGTAPILVERTITQSGVILVTMTSGADYVSVYIRRSFSVSKPLTQLTLKIDYADGFVAYLNGAEVARRGLDGQPGSFLTYDTMATLPTTGSPELIDLSPYIPNLMAEHNVLAIEVHRSAQSPLKLLVAPELTWSYDPAAVLSGESPSDVTVSETNGPGSPSPLVSLVETGGKLAVPIDNSRVAYDVYIFSMPDGREITKIPYARQPNFRFDGQRLLINREGSGVENLYEYNLGDGVLTQVSDAPKDSHPFYDSYGNRVVYGNPELTYGKPEAAYKENKQYFTGVHKPFIFVQCGLLPPHQEQEPRCRDIPSLGVLVPAGQTSEIQGTNPVWTSNDMIAYKGCNSWSGFAACGIYIVPAASTKGFSDGFIPRQITKDTSDIPSDTKGNLIAFTAHRDGNWEAYLTDLNGAGIKNLSNSASSNDGLPTISPNGAWVAFVSDRSGRWAVWAVPVIGGSAQKLFDLPTDTPWGEADRAWTNERISWGP